MSNSNSGWADVDDFIVDHLLSEDPVLEECLAANATAGLPPIDVSSTQGKMLQLLARAVSARNILEIGTLGGFSTIWLARALPDDGRLITLELDPDYTKVARTNIDHAGLSDKIEVIVGDASKSLAVMADRSFDFVFVDADKQNYPHYLDEAIRLSRPGTMIVFDNVVREGEILNPESADPKVPGTRALFEKLRNHPGVDTTAIQTVGSKKWDGFLLAVVGEKQT